jgi:hypothetical protein
VKHKFRFTVSSMHTRAAAVLRCAASLSVQRLREELEGAWEEDIEGACGAASNWLTMWCTKTPVWTSVLWVAGAQS